MDLNYKPEHGVS